MTVGELAALGTVLGVGFAIFVATIGASIAFGKLSQRVNQMDARLDRIEDAINELRAELRQMNAEIQQTNRILVGLANHRHDTDGNTAFTIPQA